MTTRRKTLLMISAVCLLTGITSVPSGFAQRADDTATLATLVESERARSLASSEKGGCNASLTSVAAFDGAALPSPPSFTVLQGDLITSDVGEKIAAAYRDGYAGFQKGDLNAAVGGFERAYALNPKDDLTVYFIAAIYGIIGNKPAALEWLGRLAAMNSCFIPSPSTFAKISDAEEFKRLAQAIEAGAARVNRSDVAFIVPEKDLIPEGMAFDPTGKAFYLSSLHKRKIVKVMPGVPGGPPAIEDFTTEGQDGLYSTLGMKIDAKRRVLWVVSSAQTRMKGYAEQDKGRTAVFKYDLVSKKLIKKYPLGPEPSHFFNDLAINPNGDVFLTDEASGEIHTIAQSRGELEVFIPAGRFASPNGITISANGRKLFVADVQLGVYVIDLKTKRVSRLTQPQGISPAGIDGLYFHDNSLIGILHVAGRGRVARFHLNSSLDGITRAEIVECNNPHFQQPTTGTLAGGWLYYIANSQFESFNPDRTIFSPEKLKDVVILKTRL